MKQVVLAGLAQIDKVRLCRIEKGGRDAKVEEMERLAAALGISVGDLSRMPPVAQATSGEAA